MLQFEMAKSSGPTPFVEPKGKMPLMHKSTETFVAAAAIAIAFSLGSAGAQANGTEKTLYKFLGGSDGALPYGSLTSDGSGNLYGTTTGGGGGSCEEGCGVVFGIAPGRKEQVLYTFTGGTDGREPEGGLIADSADNIYGTTDFGGDLSCQAGGGEGCGTVFKLAPDGTESVLYAFQGGSDGWEPFGNLVADPSGNLYGVTAHGGSFNGSDCEEDGCGTVFEVEPDGTKITLHAFQSGNDGDGPFGGVILDSAGNLYGTTGGGGEAGYGTVFKIAPDGTETILYAFQGGADGAGPVGVTIDGAGNLFGATVEGGDCTLQFYEDDCGTVYKLAADGTKTLLHDFQGGTDGLGPWAPVILDGKGNLYGTTWLGGSAYCKQGGCGTVFEVTAKGHEKVLYAFSGSHGRYPFTASLLLGAHGDLFGTTTQGGKDNHGVVFKLNK